MPTVFLCREIGSDRATLIWFACLSLAAVKLPAPKQYSQFATAVGCFPYPSRPSQRRRPSRWLDQPSCRPGSAAGRHSCADPAARPDGATILGPSDARARLSRPRPAGPSILDARGRPPARRLASSSGGPRDGGAVRRAAVPASAARRPAAALRRGSLRRPAALRRPPQCRPSFLSPALQRAAPAASPRRPAETQRPAAAAAAACIRRGAVAF